MNFCLIGLIVSIDQTVDQKTKLFLPHVKEEIEKCFLRFDHYEFN